VSAERPRLHVPSEPADRRATWYAGVLAGQLLADVVDGDCGIAGWLWDRFGPQAPFFFGAAVALCAAGLLLGFSKKLKSV